MARGRDQWLGVVKTVMNLPVAYVRGNSLNS